MHLIFVDYNMWATELVFEMSSLEGKIRVVSNRHSTAMVTYYKAETGFMTCSPMIRQLFETTMNVTMHKNC